eukprot:8690874-Ditylum_brightwellii.AAC.1
MKYHMVTSHGVDEIAVQTTTKHLIFRICQGATDAPPNWTLVLNVCQKAYIKNAKGCQITDPTTIITLNANGNVFVDNKKPTTQ